MTGRRTDRMTFGRFRRRQAMRRRLAELDRLDARYGVGASSALPVAPKHAHREVGPRSRSHSDRTATLTALVITVLLVGVVAAFHPSGAARSLRTMVGMGPDPLGRPPAVTSGEGTFTFLQTQPGQPRRPVAYDPCRPVEIVVNPEGAPPGYETMVANAVEAASESTGLTFRVAGTSDEEPGPNRPPRDIARYGVGWSPVLVAWATPDEVPALSGDVAGIGGSLALGDPGTGSRYVTGAVTLDASTFAQLQSRPDGIALSQSIINHEFGHLVGLGHVDDAGELMARENSGRLAWGPGDREGLARLGAGRCY